MKWWSVGRNKYTGRKWSLIITGDANAGSNWNKQIVTRGQWEVDQVLKVQEIFSSSHYHFDLSVHCLSSLLYLLCPLFVIIVLLDTLTLMPIQVILTLLTVQSNVWWRAKATAMPSLLRAESALLEIYKAQYNQVRAFDIVWKNCGCAVIHPWGNFWLTPRQILFHFPNFCRLSFLACFFVSLWALVACRMHYLNILKQLLGKRFRVGRTFLSVKTVEVVYPSVC